MANPAITACPVNVWTKVATNVTAGVVHIMSISDSAGVATQYFHTYRMTTDPVPTLLSEGVPLNTTETISAGAGIDVYIYCTGSAGKVRVDV